MDTKDIEKFDPTTAELKKMVEATKDLTATDLADPAQLAIVREKRIEFKRARVNIEKTGKALREDALKFQKDVIAKEKELIAIIEPEETRLAAIEEEAKALAIRKERIEKLPTRKERLSQIKHFKAVPDDVLLELDAVQFEAFFNAAVAHSNELERQIAAEDARKAEEARVAAAKADQARIDKENEAKRLEQEKKDAELRAREDAIKAEEARIAHEKEVERVKKETEERMKREQAEKEAREKAEAEAKAKAEAEAKAQAEAEAAAEKARREKQEKYRAFRAGHGWTAETASDFKEEVMTDGSVHLYKKVGVFTK